MDISVINEYIFVAAVIAAWVVCQIIKSICKKERVNDFLPLIAAIVGLVVMLAVDIPTGNFSVYTVIIGVVSGWSACGVYDMITSFPVSKPQVETED